MMLKVHEGTSRATRIPASIEASPQHVLGGKLTASLLPAGTRVYVTDVGVDPLDDYVAAAGQVRAMGYEPVPHIPVRRVESEAAMESRLRRLRDEANVDDILVIAGEADRTMGPFGESLDLLRSGLHDEIGFAHVAVAGHPEGNTAYRDVDPDGVLAEKAKIARDSDASFRIATQFGFDGPAFVRWSRAVADAGIDLPIHLGVAGPAKLTTLIKFAAMCGVGNSLNFLKKRASAITTLATKHSPEEVVEPIEKAWAEEDWSHIAGIHVFPFGGLASASEWLAERGSFVFEDQREAV